MSCRTLTVSSRCMSTLIIPFQIRGREGRESLFNDLFEEPEGEMNAMFFGLKSWLNYLLRSFDIRYRVRTQRTALETQNFVEYLNFRTWWCDTLSLRSAIFFRVCLSLVSPRKTARSTSAAWLLWSLNRSIQLEFTFFEMLGTILQFNSLLTSCPTRESEKGHFDATDDIARGSRIPHVSPGIRNKRWVKKK